jgi:hypothetical protein
MRLRKPRMRRWIAVAAAATAVAAPAGQAGHYDRGVQRQAPVDFWNYDSQTGRKIANSSPGLRPENLAQLWSGSGSERSVEIPYLSHGVGVSERGLGLSVHPDSRPLPRNAGPADPRVLGVTSVDTNGFDWVAALVGGTFGVALALLGTGGMLVAHRRRGTPTTV